MDNFARFVTKIQSVLSCSHGCLSFNYLGVSIFAGASKCQFLQSLSMMSQIQLVNTVITDF